MANDRIIQGAVQVGQPVQGAVQPKVGVQGTAIVGRNGLTPYIGDNGNWWIGGSDTGKPSQGRDGVEGYTPVKGKDYFTETEVQEIAERAVGMVESELTAKGYQTEEQVQALIDASLGVIENGTY